MTEPTKDDMLTLRRSARVLRLTSLRDEDLALVAAYMIDRILDDLDAPSLCEGCNEEGIYADDYGCYVCQSCAAYHQDYPKEEEK